MKFIEKVVIEVKGGSGGNGCIAHFELAPGKRRPTGGNGGRGGNVYIEADSSMSSLKFQTYHFNAGDGGHGGNDSRTGKRGKDVIIKVPCGTIVKERVPPEIRDFYGINDLEDLDYYNDDDDDDDDDHHADDDGDYFYDNDDDDDDTDADADDDGDGDAYADDDWWL